jgi:acyl-CoA reductase-like NAD-dependent aldehyde dehydrogenase
VPATSRLYKEKIFGPVVSILPFDDEDEAVAMANDTSYGLAATAWTNNLSRAHRLGKRLQAGTVTINCQLSSTTPCRSAGTSSPAGVTNSARTASRPT